MNIDIQELADIVLRIRELRECERYSQDFQQIQINVELGMLPYNFERALWVLSLEVPGVSKHVLTWLPALVRAWSDELLPALTAPDFRPTDRIIDRLAKMNEEFSHRYETPELARLRDPEVLQALTRNRDPA